MADMSRWTVLCGMTVILVGAGCSKDAPSNPQPNDAVVETAAASGGGNSESAAQAEARAAQAKKMKTIVKAMHAHAEANTYFPNFNSNGIPPQREGRKVGLSWRVYLLPFLGEQDLYDQFNHDEAWDGPTNKPLIEKMPDVFQSPDVSGVGMTSIHLFVTRAGVPYGSPFREFAEDEEFVSGPSPRTITDGFRSTLMFVQAGPDKADVWTKPGGLPFDLEKNPVEELGTIPAEGFFVAFFDDFVGQIKPTITPAKLKEIVQHSDAKTFDPVKDIPGIERPAEK